MSPPLVWNAFDNAVDSQASLEKIRALILRLAVTGKLARRVDSDQSVDAFLQQIWSDGGGRSRIPDAERSSPYELPSHWRWVALGEIAAFAIGKTPPRGDPSFWTPEEHPWVSIADMRHYETVTQTKERVSPLAADHVFRQRFVEPGSILMSFKLTIGKVARVGLRCFHNEAIISLNPPETELREYLFRLLPIFAKLQTSNNAIKGSTLNKGLLERLPIPLPPLTEQKRIVAKVDELMALCDRLEAQLEERDARSADLSKAALAKFSEESTVENLQYLFDPAFSITPSDLRKGILALAVRGKLVPQDSSDHPVDSMLTEIDRDKRRLGDTGALKADKRIPLAAAAAPPHVVPDAWRWVRLQDVFEVSRGGSPRPAGDARFFGGPIPWITVGEVTKDSSRYLTSTQTGLTEEGAARSRFVNVGDLLLTNSGATLGVPKIAKIRGCINDGVAVLRQFHRFDCNDYAYLCLTQQTDAFRNVNQGMGQPNLNTSIIAGWPLPLPPLAEQRRIVAKVEELMALVDQLEAQLAASEESSTKLLDALVAELAPSN